jgi:N-acetylglucosaminyldiphosphoundecaprenol N-acetyl-beta-D-mannosaminyltransferase
MTDKQGQHVPPRQQHQTISDDMAPIEILGVMIHPVTLQRLLDITTLALHRHQRMIIAYVNVHAMNLAYRLPWFRSFLNNSDIVFCDGFGVKWGARLLGHHIPQRFTPPDWIDQLAAIAAREGFSMFLLGARPGVAEKAAAQLRDRAPGLRISGTHHGFFDKNPGSAENAAVAQAINAAQPDILLIGFGMPMQERWLLENWQNVQATIALPVGAAFDYLSGEVRRGPRWMTDNGLEWLARLVIEPRRLWQRYIIGNPLFLWRVVRQRFGLLTSD